jgi:hypothetical protein
MANSYVWTINYMDTKKQEDGLTNVVVCAQWSCNATDNGTPETTASTYGYAHFGPPSTQDFTVYADLTQDQVWQWIYASGVDKDATEASLDAQIELKLNPPVVILPLPWAA